MREEVGGEVDGEGESGTGNAKGEVLWIRIKPWNKQKGQRIRRYRVFSMQIDEGRGWYKVPRYIRGMVSGREQTVDLRKYFSEVRNDSENPDSALAFDVCTAKEAAAIEEKERRAKEARRKTANPVDLTSAEVARPGESIPERRQGRSRSMSAE